MARHVEFVVKKTTRVAMFDSGASDEGLLLSSSIIAQLFFLLFCWLGRTKALREDEWCR
jgi:hypothetical protein